MFALAAAARWISMVALCLPLTSQERTISERAVEMARSISVSSLDPVLPNQPLRQWLTQSAGPGAEIDWEVTDCGEQTGNPELDRGRDFPLCVDAVLNLPGSRMAIVSVVMGTFQKGIAGMPALWSVSVRNGDGFETVEKLGDLPARIGAAN